MSFQKTRFRTRACALLAWAALGALSVAHATEGGGSAYPGGNENFLAGAAPPPGFYALIYGSSYSADTVRDNTGNKSTPPGFKLTANSVSPRLVWSTPLSLPRGNLVLHTVLPLVDLDVSVAGVSEHKRGLGDVVVGAGWSMHHSDKLHSVLALDVILPTGSYDKNAMANLGRNYRTYQPLLAASFIDPQGFNADFKLMLNLNQRNGATGYTSGKEIFMDYSAGWGVAPGWTLGVGGVVTRQITDDEQNGVKISGTRTRAIAFGPSLKYDNGKGWFLTAKFQQEAKVLNRAEGAAFWVKTNIPF